MSKNLQIVQKFFKAGKILSLIGFIGCIVGAVGCLVGLLAINGIQSIVIDGKSIADYFLEYGGMTMHTAIDVMATGTILCIGDAVLLKFAERYFAHELQDGTPFTEKGAKEILRLGILSFAIPFATSILASICHTVLLSMWSDIAELSLDNGFSLLSALIMIALSFLFRYGAELESSKNENPPFDEYKEQ